MRRTLVIGGLAVVVLILGLLALHWSRKPATGRQAASIGEALAQYHLERGRLPTTQEGLVALVRPAAGRRRFMVTPPTDPWGSPYLYMGPDVFGEARAALWSTGPDRLPNTIDDEVHVVRVGEPRAE